MDPHLAVDEKNSLLEVRRQRAKQTLPVRIVARVISYLFHPLFIPVYLFLLLLRGNGYLFASFSDLGKLMLLGTFVIMYIMFPLLSVLLLKALGFISSIHLKTQRDRVIPYVVCMIWYWWIWYVMNNRPEVPRECVILSLAIFLASIGGLMANISMKVSMHAIAAGVMAAFVMLLGFLQDLNFGFYISGSIFLSGAICTARFIDSDHTPREIYLGLFIGMVTLLLALQFA
ncbi:MAG TPA: hypothetical protein VGQ53_03220 [Chitinophagaceae bacterium]|nr:hypothetical protein [Chitinophagaceae bacterium]